MRLRLRKALWVAVGIAVLVYLVPVALTDAAMRTAERNQGVAQAFIIEQWPGFQIQGGTNTPMGLRVSRHKVVGIDGAKALTITVLVDRGRVELLGIIEHPWP